MADHKPPSTLKQFLASIATIRGDLSNITAPPFLLAPKSTVEFPAAWCEHPSLLVAPAAEPDVEKRMLLVLRWYLAALKAQERHMGGSSGNGHANGDEAGGGGAGVKKPLNSFLGELFLADWEGINNEVGPTHLISEQVSHHPPITACHLSSTHPTHGAVHASGSTRQEISFTASAHIQIRQIGHATLHLQKWEEDYIQTLPTAAIKSLLSGNPRPELEGPVYIYSSSGLVAKIEFESTGGGHLLGLVGGGRKENTLHATVYRSSEPEKVLFEVSGPWDGVWEFTDLRSISGAGVEAESGDAVESAAESEPEITILCTLNTATLTPQLPLLPPIKDQDPWESRRAWSGVISGLRAGDMALVAREKGKVEVAQREMRRVEQREGRKWEGRFFVREESGKDEVFERVLARCGVDVGEETGQVWRFDRERWEREGKGKEGKRPFREEGVTPLGYANANANANANGNANGIQGKEGEAKVVNGT